MLSARKRNELAAHRLGARELHNENPSMQPTTFVSSMSPTVTRSISANGADLITMWFSNAAASPARTSSSRILTDNVRSYVDKATYLGHGRDDSTTMFDHRNYSSVVSREVSRPVSIDTAIPSFSRTFPTRSTTCAGPRASLSITSAKMAAQ